MASVLVTSLRGSNKSSAGVSLIATCYFSGDDVPIDVEGYPYEVPVDLVDGYNLADLKAALLAAVQVKATTLSLTVQNQNIDIPSYDSFGA